MGLRRAKATRPHRGIPGRKSSTEEELHRGRALEIFASCSWVRITAWIQGKYPVLGKDPPRRKRGNAAGAYIRWTNFLSPAARVEQLISHTGSSSVLRSSHRTFTNMNHVLGHQTNPPNQKDPSHTEYFLCPEWK